MKMGILLLAALPLAAADGIAGKWSITGDIVGHPVVLNCSVEAKAEAKIAGTCTLTGSDGTESVKISGEAKGEKFNFEFTTGSGYTLAYAGMLQGDTIQGGIEVSGASGTFTGKRSAE
jgi:hypothetical protein